MGRVDEAMRRAAARSETSETIARLAGPVSPSALDELVPEADPASVEASSPSRMVETTLAPGSVNGQTPASGESTAGAPQILERVDAIATEKLVVSNAMPVSAREQYRRLAAVLHASQEATGLKVVMVASAVPAEGKTLTASNLALTLSESYQRRVLLIDADLRRPSLDSLFGIACSTGLSDGLATTRDARLPIQQASKYLAVIPAGRPTADPMAGLTSERMRRLVDEARTLFDWIIIDTPPIVLLPDAHLLASMVDGTLLVVRAAETPHDLVRRAVDAIHRDRILGVVLNGAKAEHQTTYGQYAGYYHRYHATGASSA